MKTKLTKQEAIAELWRRGNLSWLLDSNQKELYKLFHESEFKVQTWLLCRRTGKTFGLAVLAIEACLKQANCIVKFLSPTRLQVRNNLRPLIRQILESCPEEYKPEFKAKDDIYYFKNGSEIQLAGSDSGHAEKLRGGASQISIVDEAGDVTGLEYIVKSILLPTTLTTNGKVLIAGTPPKASEHDFLKIIEEAEMRGSLIRKTIDDNPRLTLKQKKDFIEEMGGIESEACQRELYCKIIKDAKTSVIPEFTQALEKEIIKEWPRPPFYDCYESMDIGFNDLTAILFAYYDFKADKIIIEDELAINGQDLHLSKLVEQIKDKEKDLWYDPITNEVRQPALRVSDINYIVTQEIQRHSNNKINFVATKKDDKEAALNTVRMMLANKKIIINPRCQTLIRHLRNVKWASQNNQKTFARSPDDSHYDMVDSLVYLVRNIYYQRNPYPSTYGMELKDLYYVNKNKFDSPSSTNVYKKIFNIK